MSDIKEIFTIYCESKQDDSQVYTNKDGTKEWFNFQGHRHRLGGPAVERTDGFKSWYMDGMRHRDDGPAIVYEDGEESWYIKGTRYDDIIAWAEAALKYNDVEPTQDAIDAKVIQVMQQDLFS